MTSMTTVKCANCKTEFEARTADINRGWGKFCSKVCKAKKQTATTGIVGPDYRAGGRTVSQMQNGKYTKSQFRGRNGSGRKSGDRWYKTNVHYESWDEEVERGDVKYSRKHGCWLVRDDGTDPLIDMHPFDSENFNNT